MESVLFFPIMLLALIGITYISQAAIISERAVFAVRYGSQVSYQSNAYSIESMYNWYWTQTDPTTTDPACSSTATAITKAVYQAEEPSAAPSAYPTAPSYFQPSTTPSSSCRGTIATFDNSASGNSYLAIGFGSVTSSSVTASVNVPVYFQSLLGSTFSTTATMSILNPPNPTAILGCRPFIAGPMAEVLSGNSSSPYDNYVTPSNGNPHNC